MTKLEMPSLETTGEFDEDTGQPLYRHVKKYRYELGAGCHIDIPEGDVTNLGTIPKLFWWFIAPHDIMGPSAIHDYCCNEYFGGVDEDSGFSRWMADAIFYETCIKFDRIGRIKSTLAYWALRAYARWHN